MSIQVAQYITHDLATQYTLVDDGGAWRIEHGYSENDFEVYPGGVAHCTSGLHARETFERLITDDVTALWERKNRG